MIRFDWHRYEPLEARRDGWPEPISANLLNRYDGFLREPSPWRDLVIALFERPATQPFWIEWLDAFDHFLDDIPAAILPPEARGFSPQKPCVCISHQRLDADNGLRAACLADHQHVDCWLDVLDPTLNFINSSLVNDPRYSLLVAATIEIALLCSTHVIALQTVNSAASRWVAYELGRAKARKIRSTQAACWMQHGQTPATCGDYVQLTVMTHNEADVAAWLAAASGRPTQPPPLSPCVVHNTTLLK